MIILQCTNVWWWWWWQAEEPSTRWYFTGRINFYFDEFFEVNTVGYYKTLTSGSLDSGSECGDGNHGICSIINNWQDADPEVTNTYETLIKTSNDNSKYTECILGTIETCGSNSFGYNDNCSDGFLGGQLKFFGKI